MAQIFFQLHPWYAYSIVPANTNMRASRPVPLGVGLQFELSRRNLDVSAIRHRISDVDFKRAAANCPGSSTHCGMLSERPKSMQIDEPAPYFKK
jgi:hypothetical protein